MATTAESPRGFRADGQGFSPGLSTAAGHNCSATAITAAARPAPDQPADGLPGSDRAADDAASTPATLIQVAVAAPVPELFLYLPPVAAGPPAQPGCRVLVPFGRGQRIGLVVAQITAAAARLPPAPLKSVARVLDPSPLLGAADLAFVRWAGDYYRCPPGEALFTALPARLRRPTASLAGAVQPDPGPESNHATLNDANTKRPPARALNAEQAHAVSAVSAQVGFGCFLLDGVTGSGKTEVYLHLIAQALTRGRQVLILVPEIGLTPQLAERIGARIAAPLALSHSGLTPRTRELAWHQAASGQARLLLGTRSAVFTPLPDLGLVIVDEEHDPSLKQQEGFRYSARDLAVRRAQLAACPALLGSATPALESLHNARRGRYRHLQLPRRAGTAVAPRILLADIRAQPLESGLSHALLTRVEATLAAGDQALLFLNRRGFAPVLTCHDCGWISECPHCDARMTLHRDQGQLRCHHCGASRALPTQCPYCQSPDLRPLGQGTERVEDSLRRRFPGIPLARIDRDSTRRRGELARLLAAARRGDYPLLLGTQMLAKGHHLPGVTLVGVMDLDHGLYGSDFRAAERMAQVLIQVAGRAGRAERPGTVLVQTRHPGHPLLRHLLRAGYGAFAAAALAERAEAQLPPFSHQALLRADSPQEQAALAFLRQARGLAAGFLAQTARPGVELWGPAPSNMERRADRYRAQLLLQAPRRALLQALLDPLLPALRGCKAPRHLRWGIDVDPQEAL